MFLHEVLLVGPRRSYVKDELLRRANRRRLLRVAEGSENADLSEIYFKAVDGEGWWWTVEGEGDI
jgi:hypothetical protein